MSFAQKYIDKYIYSYSFKNQSLNEFDIIVVIPAIAEPKISSTLQSLETCNTDQLRIAVLVVINSPEDATNVIIEQNKACEKIVANYKKSTNIYFESIWCEKLKKKHAGAGWARKIGMDWAIINFNNNSKPNGIVVSLDADTTVQKNYFIAIHSFYQKYPKHIAATIHFEHSFSDPELSQKQIEGAMLYELYMRCYKKAMEYTGFPYAIYTIGSAFSFKAKAYVDQGGMNRKKAGEDFYFLHKLTSYGSIGNIVDTKVSPSSRISKRVPFGTGTEIEKWINGSNHLLEIYNIECYFPLKQLFSTITDLYQTTFSGLHKSITSISPLLFHFCVEYKIIEQLISLSDNCASSGAFKKRFFDVFNAFTILKWLNYAHEHQFKKQKLTDFSSTILSLHGLNKTPDDLKLLLILFRELEIMPNRL